MERVDVDAEEEVHAVDERLGTDDGLPEVHGMTHLRHEGDEDEAAAVRVDGLVKTVERSDEADTTGSHVTGRRPGVGVDGTFTKLGTKGLGRSQEVGAMSSHDNTADKNVLVYELLSDSQ